MRISVLLYLIVVSSLLLIGNTSSYFKDIEKSYNNTFTAGSAYIANHLVISEVQIKGDGDRDHDFIEIYNPTDLDINLSNYKGDYVKLVKYTSTGRKYVIKSWKNDFSVVPSHGFYLWASGKDSNYPSTIGADCCTEMNIGSNNAVALEFSNGSIIDLVGWGASIVNETLSFPFNPQNNQSIERKALFSSDNTTMGYGEDKHLGNGHDTNNNFNDFILRDCSDPQNSSSSKEDPPWPPYGG